MSDLSMASVLSGEPVEAPPPEAAPEPTPEPQEAETGENTAPPADAEPGESTEAEPKKQVPLDALHAERAKARELQESNRELERQLAELRGKTDALMSVHKPQEPEENPEDEFYSDPIKFLEKEKETLRKEYSQQLQAYKMQVSEDAVRRAHPDADEVILKFVEVAKANPGLIERMNGHPDPARFAYDTGKLYMETEDVGSVSELREKIERDVRAKVEAELKQQMAAQAAGAITPTNASSRGTGATTAPAFSGPTSWEKLLAH